MITKNNYTIIKTQEIALEYLIFNTKKSWNNASRFCLENDKNWRIPTIKELRDIYFNYVNWPAPWAAAEILNPKEKTEDPFVFKVKNEVFNVWSSEMNKYTPRCVVQVHFKDFFEPYNLSNNGLTYRSLQTTSSEKEYKGIVILIR